MRGGVWHCLHLKFSTLIFESRQNRNSSWLLDLYQAEGTAQQAYEFITVCFLSSCGADSVAESQCGLHWALQFLIRGRIPVLWKAAKLLWRIDMQCKLWEINSGDCRCIFDTLYYPHSPWCIQTVYIREKTTRIFISFSDPNEISWCTLYFIPPPYLTVGKSN